ncbi:RNA polymerase sigma factor [Sphingomonas sp. 1P08PE]|uniref:RNA polymerase sigma factor n=1 Tax=Sphingomonas sp. 1P08PE TaxID=554122 RepID=UPI0039A2E9F0
MSRPPAAKGVGACLKHVLNTRLAPALPRTLGQEGHATVAARARFTSVRMPDPSTVRLACVDGDPLPPDSDIAPSETLDLDALYRVEQPRLVRALMRFTTADRAQDAVQQVFMRLTGRDAIATRDVRSPRAYVREATMNAVRDEVRAVTRFASDADLPRVGCPHTAVDPLPQLEARDRLRRIEAAVQGLKPLTKQIFLARRLDGYSYAEIAARTGLSERGVEKQMRIALRHLGRHLRSHD